MAGIVAIIIKIMPDSPKADLNKIKIEAKKILKSLGALNLSFEEVPIAFGLKAIMIKFAWPEEKDTGTIEFSLAKIIHVSSINIEDYRRAFG